jgi:dTDP-4-amino-4,6-dideoxygalactose transaminase
LVEYPEIDVIVVIHYFGWPGANMEIIRSICNTANITLIEDCAHAFHWGHPKQNLGIKGDYAFYSIHKYLPVKSGGILHAINKPIRIEMEPADNNLNFEIIEVLSKAQLDKIALRRRLNFKRAVNGISKFKGITILRSNIPLTPQSLPVLIHGEGIREKVYFSLLKKGIATTALYYRLHEYIDKINFESSFQISDQILNIPIHQDLTNNMIDEMINEFKISLVEATK